jgi:hypothetical protein
MRQPNQTKQAIQLIASSNEISGIHKADGEILDIDYVNKNPQEDDIVICGGNNTIFLEDFEDCIIVDNTIKVSNYILHIK